MCERLWNLHITAYVIFATLGRHIRARGFYPSYIKVYFYLQKEIVFSILNYYSRLQARLLVPSDLRDNVRRNITLRRLRSRLADPATPTGASGRPR